MPRRALRPIHLRPSRVCLAGLALAAAWSAQAQEVVSSRKGLFLPSLAAEGSYVEGRGRPGDGNGREGILRLSPGFRWIDRAGAVQGDVDYVGDLFTRKGRGTDDTDYRNTLSARLRGELQRGFAFVDGAASITQQAVSAFGQQSVAGSLQANTNQTEVRTFSVSPFLRGSAGGLADYEIRVGAGRTSTHGGTEVPPTRTSDALFRLASPRSGARFGWNLVATQRRSETGVSSGLANADESRARGTLIWSASPQLQLSANAGAESVDEGPSVDRHRGKTGGLGLQWAPSPVTALSGEFEHRYVGNTGRLNFSTRGPRTVFSYSITRDTTFGIDGNAIGAPMTMFQLFFAQAATRIPDPVVREQAVLAELLALGLDPNQIVSTPLLGRGYSLQRRQDLSVAFTGRRLTLTVFAFTSSSAGFVATAPGAEAALDQPVVQHGYSSTLAYRLTPQTTVTLGGSRRMTFATQAATGNDLKSAEISLASQVGLRTTARLTARYSVFNSVTDPYRDTSLSTSITLRF